MEYLYVYACVRVCINYIRMDEILRKLERERQRETQSKRNEEFSALLLFFVFLCLSACACRILNGSEALMERRLTSVISHNFKDIKTKLLTILSRLSQWLTLI